MQYPMTESKILEFKERLDEYGRLLETVTAFSNTQGGTIVIGVRNQDRVIVGLKREEILRYNEEIPQAIVDAIVPQIAVQLYEQDFEGKTCLILQAFPGPQKPYFIKKEGYPNGVYLRFGSHNRVADEYALRQLEQLTLRRQFEDTPCPQITYDDLSPDLLGNVFTSYSQAMLIGSGLATVDVSGNVIPTVAGTLLFYPHHKKIIPESTVVVSWYSGIDTKQLIRTSEFSGGIIPMIDQAYTYLLGLLGSSFEQEGLVKKPSTLAIPSAALREALVNAVAHRSYDFESPIRIQLFSNRIELINPGVFYAPIHAENLRQGLSRYRNPLIADALRKVHYMEKQGTGINLIIEACLDAGLNEPQFVELEHYLKVVMFFKKIDDGEQPDLEEAQLYFSARGKFTTREYAQYIGRSLSMAKKILYDLREIGAVEMIGKGPATAYRFIQPKEKD